MAANSLLPAGPPRRTTTPTVAEVIDGFRAALGARDIVAPTVIRAWLPKLESLDVGARPINGVLPISAQLVSGQGSQSHR